MPNIFSFDAETDGLWGSAFAIGALVFDENGTEIARFFGRLPESFVTNPWVVENVLPTLQGLQITHMDYVSLLSDFAQFFLAYSKGAEVIVHMGYIVEVKILRDMFEQGFMGEWDAPYPLFDVADFLMAAGADPTSVDNFASEKGLKVVEFVGKTHDPLYDSAITALVYLFLTKGISSLNWKTG